MVTARDRLPIQFPSEEMWSVVQDFSDLDPEDARKRYRLSDDAQGWKVESAQTDLRYDKGPHTSKVVPMQYRPFDVRGTYYTGRSVGFMGRPRPT